MIESLLTSLLPGALLVLVTVAQVDTLPRPVRTLPAVDVRAERARLDARRRMPTADVTDLRAGASNRASESVAELLATTVGARVVQYGGLGSFSTLSLRGAAPGQTSVFLDGVPLTSATHGVVNLADLPVSAIDRIEVYRGTAPLAFGAATPGGAVNLVTVDAPRARTLRVAGGSFGTTMASGTIARSSGRLALLAHAGVEGWNGDYAFLDDNGTAFNRADDEVTTRRNNRHDAATALARAAWTCSGGDRLTLRAEGFRSAQGIPGLGAIQAPNPRLSLERGVLALELAHAPTARGPGLTLRGHAQQERSHFRDREGELSLGRQDGSTRSLDEGAGLDVATPAGWSGLTLAAGVAGRHERARGAPPTLGQAEPPASTRGTVAAHAGAQLHLAGGAVLLHAARRWDRQRDDVRATVVGGAAYAADARRTLDAPQLGARVRLPRGFSVRASWSRSARAPEFGELFGDQLVVAANPRLQPEWAENRDAGAAWEAGGTRWRAGAGWTTFASHERSLIAWVPAAARTVRATNVGRAELRGEELEAHAAWGAVAASLGAGWTSALQTDRASIYYGRRLPLRPSRQAAARVDARAGAWRLSADALYLGDDYLDPINFQRLPSRTLVGASLSWTAGVLRWTVEGKNLGDRRTQDVAGYPLPGRSVFASCEARVGPDSDSRP